MQALYKCSWAIFAVMLVCAQSVADEPKASEKPEVIKSEIKKEGKSCCCFGACTINFQSELGSTFDYLGSLGAQIHAARRKPDPVALAMAARSLAVAEEVSGKKAKVTAQQVLDEAVKLAQMRDHSAELRAVSLIVTDVKLRNDLAKQGEAAAEFEAEERERLANSEESKCIVGTLHVTNFSPECVNCYVDGRYLGEVHHGQSRRFHVHSHRNPNILEAYCVEGGELVNHQHFFGHTHHLDWHIH